MTTPCIVYLGVVFQQQISFPLIGGLNGAYLFGGFRSQTTPNRPEAYLQKVVQKEEKTGLLRAFPPNHSEGTCKKQNKKHLKTAAVIPSTPPGLRNRFEGLGEDPERCHAEPGGHGGAHRPKPRGGRPRVLPIQKPGAGFWGSKVMCSVWGTPDGLKGLSGMLPEWTS